MGPVSQENTTVAPGCSHQTEESSGDQESSSKSLSRKPRDLCFVGSGERSTCSHLGGTPESRLRQTTGWYSGIELLSMLRASPHSSFPPLALAQEVWHSACLTMTSSPVLVSQVIIPANFSYTHSAQLNGLITFARHLPEAYRAAHPAE